jgi:hypothetical protein
LKDLLPPNILQPPIQILNLLNDIMDLSLIRRVQRAGLADGQVQLELDAAHVREGVEPAASARRRRRREADLVLAGPVSCEGEFPGCSPLLRYYAVVFVENFL